LCQHACMATGSGVIRTVMARMWKLHDCQRTGVVGIVGLHMHPRLLSKWTQLRQAGGKTPSGRLGTAFVSKASLWGQGTAAQHLQRSNSTVRLSAAALTCTLIMLKQAPHMLASLTPCAVSHPAGLSPTSRQAQGAHTSSRWARSCACHWARPRSCCHRTSTPHLSSR
jgi:hypothetical protein